MVTLDEAAAQFLSCHRIAVAGVSRSKTAAANVIYKKLKSAGHSVFAVNPQAELVEGDRCYPSLAAIPGGVEGVVVVTRPEISVEVVRECIALGIRQVWLHRSFGHGSYSEAAVKLCEEHGIAVIPGACPMMYCEPVDHAHKCFLWFQHIKRRPPQPINYHEPVGAG